MGELNLAVWGLGAHAMKTILPAVRATRGLRLYGVCSRAGDAVAAASQDYGCLGWTDADGLLGDANVDAVYLSTPPGLHAAFGRRILRSGKHFWCEKPFATVRAEADDLITSSRERDLTLGEAFMYLHHPQFVALRHLFTGGELGEVRTVASRFGIPTLSHPGYRLAPDLGGGALLDVGVYPVSALLALFPDSEFTVDYAEMVTHVGSPVDTGGRAVLHDQFDGSGVLEWRTGAAYRNDIDVWGTRGSVTTDRIFSKRADYAPELRILDGHGGARYHGVPAADQFVLMFEWLLRLVDDRHLAECERQSIARRARLVDAIKDESLERSGSSARLEAGDAR